MVPYFMIQSAFSLVLMVNHQKIRSDEKAVLVDVANIMSVEDTVVLSSSAVKVEGEAPPDTCLVVGAEVRQVQ